MMGHDTGRKKAYFISDDDSLIIRMDKKDHTSTNNPKTPLSFGNFGTSTHLPTNAPVLSLPREKVQQRREGLPDQTETNPEDAVADDFAVEVLGAFQPLGGEDEGDLDDHADEGDA